MNALRQIALAYPEVAHATVCNKTAYKAHGKSFLFIGEDDASYNVMLKLADSLAEAAKLAAKHPEAYKVGVHGWVTAIFPRGKAPPAGLFERWIDESFRLLAPKQLVATTAASPAKTPGSQQRKSTARGRGVNK